MQHSERRKNPRFKCRKPADFPIHVASEENIGWLKNLSRGGIAFESNSSFKENQQCYFEIKPKLNAKSIPVEACIMWAVYSPATSGCLCGARILNMDSSSKIDLLDMFYEDWKKTVITEEAGF